MLMPFSEKKPPLYKSFKAEKFHKTLERVRALIQSVHDSSLKDEDKRQLLNEMRKEIK